MATMMPDMDDNSDDEPDTLAESAGAELQREAIQATVEYHVDISDVDDERLDGPTVDRDNEQKYVCRLAADWAYSQLDLTHKPSAHDVVAQPVDEYGDKMQGAYKAVVRLNESVSDCVTARQIRDN